MSEINFGTFNALVIGMRCKDFVIVGVTKRSLYGPIIVSEKATVTRIFDNIILAFAGHISDIQYIFREAEWLIRIGRLERERRLSITEIANEIGLLMFSYKLFPNIVFGIIGGVDVDGRTKLYDIDPLGSLLEENYTAAGLCADVAIGLLEENYDENMTLENAKKLFTKILSSVAKRNVLVGMYAELSWVSKKSSGTDNVKLL